MIRPMKKAMNMNILPWLGGVCWSTGVFKCVWLEIWLCFSFTPSNARNSKVKIYCQIFFDSLLLFCVIAIRIDNPTDVYFMTQSGQTSSTEALSEQQHTNSHLPNDPRIKCTSKQKISNHHHPFHYEGKSINKNHQ